MKKKFRVKLVSKDDQTFLFNSAEKTEMAAIAEAEQRIKDKGWDHYQYVYHSIEKIHKAMWWKYIRQCDENTERTIKTIRYIL